MAMQVVSTQDVALSRYAEAVRKNVPRTHSSPDDFIFANSLNGIATGPIARTDASDHWLSSRPSSILRCLKIVFGQNPTVEVCANRDRDQLSPEAEAHQQVGSKRTWKG
jgi:hypothetical protein